MCFSLPVFEKLPPVTLLIPETIILRSVVHLAHSCENNMVILNWLCKSKNNKDGNVLSFWMTVSHLNTVNIRV